VSGGVRFGALRAFDRGYGVAVHTVVVLALDGVVAFDPSTPGEVFGRVRLSDGRAPYRMRVCGPAGEVEAGVFSVRVHWGFGALAAADTIVLPGRDEQANP
jgi:hypothetical protein